MYRMRFALAMVLLLAPWAVLANKPLITSAAYTHPQRLVDVGHGRWLNLYCMGHGSPTVIMEAGLGDSTISWALVQPAIARHTRACAYDRAGLGFSDAARRPSTAANDADDLHRLVVAAGLRPPYLLVAHSAGGMYVRVFADRYPKQVAGMVLVEPSHEDQSTTEWAIGKPGRKKAWDAYLNSYAQCIVDARRGLKPGTPAYDKCVGKPDPRFSAAINAAQEKYASTVRWQSAVTSEARAVFYASAEQTRATRRHFGDIPIIVLTHAPYPKGKDETQAIRDQRTLLWERLHNQIAAMSTRGVDEIVPGVGHYIQYDKPQVVIDAVDEALAIARSQQERGQVHVSGPLEPHQVHAPGP